MIEKERAKIHKQVQATEVIDLLVLLALQWK